MLLLLFTVFVWLWRGETPWLCPDKIPVTVWTINLKFQLPIKMSPTTTFKSLHQLPALNDDSGGRNWTMLLERALSRFEGKILELNDFSFSLIMLKMGQYQIGKPINPIQRKLLIVVLRKRKVFMAGADPSSVVVVRPNQNKHCLSNQASTMSENLSTTYLCLDYKNCGGKGCHNKF